MSYHKVLDYKSVEVNTNIHLDRILNPSFKAYQDYKKESKPFPNCVQSGIDILTFFEDKCYPFRRYLNQFPKKEFLGNIDNFIIGLDSYIESKGIMTSSEVIFLNSSFERQKSLKNLRKRAFLDTIGATLVEDDPDLKFSKDYCLSDIGQIFNYNYGIHFEEPDEMEFKKMWRNPCRI